MVPYIYYEDATEGFWGTTCNNELVTRIVSPVFRKKNYKMGTLFHRKEFIPKALQNKCKLKDYGFFIYLHRRRWDHCSISARGQCWWAAFISTKQRETCSKEETKGTVNPVLDCFNRKSVCLRDKQEQTNFSLSRVTNKIHIYKKVPSSCISKNWYY